MRRNESSENAQSQKFMNFNFLINLNQFNFKAEILQMSEVYWRSINNSVKQHCKFGLKLPILFSFWILQNILKLIVFVIKKLFCNFLINSKIFEFFNFIFSKDDIKLNFNYKF